MGMVSGLLKGKCKQNAYHSDALVLKEVNPDGQENEKVVYFIIVPQKKKNLFSLALIDGAKAKYLETNLSLQTALSMLKQRFHLKHKALDTVAQTRGALVVVDNQRRPGEKDYNWLHTREIFNFVASDTIDGPIN